MCSHFWFWSFHWLQLHVIHQEPISPEDSASRINNYDHPKVKNISFPFPFALPLIFNFVFSPFPQTMFHVSHLSSTILVPSRISTGHMETESKQGTHNQPPKLTKIWLHNSSGNDPFIYIFKFKFFFILFYNLHPGLPSPTSNPNSNLYTHTHPSR